ncbi:S-adenosyl-L-methionine-dependent methyltransferase [Aspergillus welwitschiae]|uniref:Velvet complex subunit laeA n=1 Tax=Aspergillus welwitschiae TaxID=1341132 RepID=A0A3F3PV81_9EURO|nr:S-adenosyl-L-methionine-dependent methyltransferase [Aspergillus welwitschiae]RDH30840.1 S-adenosyl-L-methionine-dependent methyltransferase [Aspergillus welwitschiae]
MNHPREQYGQSGRKLRLLKTGSPFDDQEQDRLDFFHKVFSIALMSEKIVHVPYPKNGRFLDLGCGTGIWAIDIAQQLPSAFVVGVDLAPIQPPNKPENCIFRAPFDLESTWTLGENEWDVIYLRMGCGDISDWQGLYRKVYAHLCDGGWLEQIEIDFTPRSVRHTKDDCAMQFWYQSLTQATEKAMRPLAHCPQWTMQKLQEAGFVEIHHHQVGLPLGQWHNDDYERLVGLWYRQAFTESIEPLSVVPFRSVLGWSPDQIRHLATQVKSEALTEDNCNYNILHLYRARRPMY